ncbi:MAG: Uma2 family endonuclease [Anaerolineae bacterium]|nr:Uma2 family endonuclease [Anaerolineae bacterium]
MVIQQKNFTVEAFEAFAQQPENRERRLEYIGGEVVEVVSNPLSSKIAAKVIIYLGMYLLQNDIGHVTGADGGYRVSGERYIPDAAFISYARQPQLAYVEGYNPNAPDLAVEVLSPGNAEEEMTIKVANYLAAGAVVWMISPAEQQVIVFVPGQPAQRLTVKDTLDGGTVLPGFSCAVRDIFPKQEA